MTQTQHSAVLLLQTGSPDAPTPEAVRRYLRTFLMDPRIIDIPFPARWLLVNAVIAPFRTRHSVAAYRRVWTPNGPPLLVHTQALQTELRRFLPHVSIELGMAYGRPSIPEAFARLLHSNPQRIVVVPLFPQYASASTGAVLAQVYTHAAQLPNVPSFSVLPPFYNETGFLEAWSVVARPALDAFAPEHVVLSFHGLPERHIRRADVTGKHCLNSSGCCDAITSDNSMCYRAQCFATARLLADWLALENDEYTVAFQSRMGGDKWLEPATSDVVVRLAREGRKRVAVLCPSFVLDCLETLEEIGMRLKEDFLNTGGQDFLLVPSLNDHPTWAGALASMLQRLL